MLINSFLVFQLLEIYMRIQTNAKKTQQTIWSWDMAINATYRLSWVRRQIWKRSHCRRENIYTYIQPLHIVTTDSHPLSDPWVLLSKHSLASLNVMHIYTQNDSFYLSSQMCLRAVHWVCPSGSAASSVLSPLGFVPVPVQQSLMFLFYCRKTEVPSD